MSRSSSLKDTSDLLRKVSSVDLLLEVVEVVVSVGEPDRLVVVLTVVVVRVAVVVVKVVVVVKAVTVVVVKVDTRRCRGTVASYLAATLGHTGKSWTVVHCWWRCYWWRKRWWWNQDGGRGGGGGEARCRLHFALPPPRQTAAAGWKSWQWQ